MLASLYYHTRDLYLFKPPKYFKVEQTQSFVVLICLLGLIASFFSTISIWQFGAHLGQEAGFLSLWVETAIRHFFVVCLLFLVSSPQKILNISCLLCAVHLVSAVMVFLHPLLGSAASAALLLSFCAWSTAAFFRSNKSKEYES